MSSPTPALDARWPVFRHPLVIAAGVVIVLGVLEALYRIHDVLLLGMFALLLAVVLSFPVNFLAKRMPRGLAVVVTLVAAGALGAAVALVVLPLISGQLAPLTTQIPKGVHQAKDWLEGRSGSPVAQLPQAPQIAKHVESKVGEFAEVAAIHAFPAALSLAEAAFTLILVLVLAAFLVHEPDIYRRGLRQLLPASQKPVFDETWRRLGTDLHKWVGGILISMVLMGAFCGAGLALIGMEGWAILGLITFAGTFVPYAGALASAIPGLLVALAHSPTKFVEACGVYLAVHIVEGYFVQPVVMRRAVELKPAMLLFGQACLGAIFGVMGIVVATPLMVVGKSLVQYLWVERKLGGALGQE